MEDIRNFLESSTIHGLAYIATTRKAVQIFWVCVILAGFTSAFFMIKESFDNWSKNPVTTTLETHPITDFTFPKVAVCPPKGTYTNLNYDLMRVGNMTMSTSTDDTEDEKNAMVQGILYDMFEKILEHEYQQALMLHLEEDDKYMNWYYGYSFEENPLIPGCVNDWLGLCKGAGIFKRVL